MNRRPLLAWTAALLVLALSFPALAAAAPSQADPEPGFFTITGHVTAQGRTVDQVQTVSLSLRLDTKSGEVTVYPDMQTNEDGYFKFDVLGFSDDPYTWRVKGAQTLATSGDFKLGSVDLIQMGTQTTGDANNDNVVNIVDFNIIRGTFGKDVGGDGYDARADFTGDGPVNIRDYNLMRGNFGNSGVDPLN